MKYENEQKLKRDPRVRSYTSPSGDKKYRVTFKKTINGKVIRFEKQGFDTANQAIKWADEELTKMSLRNGLKVTATVQEYYIYWSKKNIDNDYWTPDALRTSDAVFKTYILPKFGNYRLDQVTREVFQNYVNEMQNVDRGTKIGYSTATIQSVRRAIGALMNDAVYSEQLDMNRIQRIHIKSGVHVKNKKISPETFKRAIEVARSTLDPVQYAGFMLSTLGLRHGEILGIKVSDIHKDHLSVHMARTNAAPEGTNTKTAASIREVPLTQLMYNVLTAASYQTLERVKAHKLDITDPFLIVDKERS